MNRLVAALAFALLLVSNPLIDSGATERVECLFYVTFEEGHSWEDCLS